MKKNVVILMLATIIAFSFYTSAMAAGQPQPATVKFVYSSTLDDLPIIAAQKFGLFKEEGIDVEIMPINKANEVMAALTGNLVQFASWGFATVPILAANGKDVKIIFMPSPVSNYELFANKNFKTLADLVEYKKNTGKKAKIAINDVTSQNFLMLKRALINSGVSQEVMDESFDFIPIGGTSLRLNAMIQGQVDATNLLPPFNFIGKSAGFNVLIPAEKYPLSPTVVIAVMGDYLKKNPQVVEKVVRALIKAVTRLSSEPQKTKELMISSFGLEKQAERVNTVLLEECIKKYQSMGISYDDAKLKCSNIQNQPSPTQLLPQTKDINGQPPVSPITAQDLADSNYDFLKKCCWSLKDMVSMDLVKQGYQMLPPAKNPYPAPETLCDFSIAEKVMKEFDR